MAIPASNLVSITPRVLSGTGSDLVFNGLFLSQNSALPANTLQPFYSASEVSDFFGSDSTEYSAASAYFNGFDNSDTKPTLLYFFRRPVTSEAAFVRSGTFDGTQAQVLAAINKISQGTFTATVNGVETTVTGIDLTGSSSLSAAADRLQEAIRGADVTDDTASNDYATAVEAGDEGNNISIKIELTDADVNIAAAAATSAIGSAKTAGTAGNALTVVVELGQSTDGVGGAEVGSAEVTAQIYTVTTKNGDEVVDVQEGLTEPGELVDNDYVTFNKTGVFVPDTYIFTGGVDADVTSFYTVSVLVDDAAVIAQTGVTSAADLVDNQYVTWNKSAELAAGTYPLSGGKDNGAKAWQEATVEYSSNLNAFTLTLGETGSAVSIEDCTGTAAEVFYLTEDQGATYSEGCDPLTVTEAMEAVVDLGQNFVTFSSIEALTDDEIVELAQWSNTQYNNGTQFLFIFNSEDSKLLDATSTDTIADTLQELEVNGTAGIYGDVAYAAFLMGSIASIDWDANNSTITLAFKSQSGLGATVSTESAATALENKCMNFVGDYASRNDSFVFNYGGQMFGEWSWIDSYIGSIWLTNALQVQIMEGLQTAKRVPYNEIGYTFIRAWCSDVIERGLTNGVISTGVNLSQTQITELQQDAGQDISNELYNNGYYLQIEDATANIRQARTSPTLGLWYTDAGSVHRISMPVTTVQ